MHKRIADLLFSSAVVASTVLGLQTANGQAQQVGAAVGQGLADGAQTRVRTIVIVP